MIKANFLFVAAVTPPRTGHGMLFVGASYPQVNGEALVNLAFVTRRAAPRHHPVNFVTGAPDSLNFSKFVFDRATC
jgi:hypothetical protein